MRIAVQNPLCFYCSEAYHLCTYECLQVIEDYLRHQGTMLQSWIRGFRALPSLPFTCPRAQADGAGELKE